MRLSIDRGAAALLRAIRAWDGGAVLLEEQHSRPWASATFVGARHRLEIRLAGMDAERRAERLAGALPQMEFSLARLLVADVAVAARPAPAALVIEALVLDEA